MANGVRFYTGVPFEIDANGAPGAGFQYFFYVTGTSTPQNTYSDSGLTIANPNPVVADGNGRFGNIFLGLSQAYKVALYSANPDPNIPSTPSDPQGTQIWTVDPWNPQGYGQSTAGIISEVRDFGGLSTSVPAGWLLCYGQAISRATYSLLFAVIGTTYGTGDGSTTFNIPDCRGRVSAGIDNMGGSAANRITAGVCGVPSTTLGGAGGDQNTQGDTYTATTTLTDPGHFHTTTSSGTANHDGSAFIEGGTTWDLARDVDTNAATTGITAATTVTGTNSGASQNVQPTIMFNKIMYAGA